jgi:D-alanyl-D-alanine dipeptidase
VFSDLKTVQNLDRLHYLRSGLVERFLSAARDMNDRGWVMRVEDSYRTRAIQKHLALKEGLFDSILKKVMWELGGQRPTRELMLQRITPLIATRPKFGTHMSGSAIDISVLRRDNRKEVDRGGPYLEMSELTPMASPFITAVAARNRKVITDIMSGHGFAAYPYEFWHYSQGDACDEQLNHTGRPGRYGAVDLDTATGKVTPITDPMCLLNSLEEIQAHTERAFARITS